MNKKTMPNAIVLSVGTEVEDVERITARNQRRKRGSEARERKRKRAKVRNAAATLWMVAFLILAMACAAVGPWWTAVSPLVLMVGVMRKAGWV